MRRTRSQRLYVYFAVFMAVIMGASLVFPALQDNTVQQQIEPTEAPTSTVPAPPPDPQAISLNQTYFHPSGLFTIAQPEGWAPGSPSNNGTQAQINMRNPELLSVIEAYVEIPAASVTDLAGLDAHFNDAMVEAGWRSYSNARETARRRDEENNRLIIDFELEQARQNYLARHIAWTDGSWIYVVRVVVTPNMLDLLNYLISSLPPTLQPQKLFAESPAGWTSFYNPQGNEIIRYPSGWVVTDGQPGSLVTISGTSGETLRLEIPTEVTIADEAAARAYVEELRPGVTLGTVQTVERNGATGFAVSHNSTTLEGEETSGLTTLLNGEDGLLHVASVRIPQGGLDLNALTEGAPTSAAEAADVMESFNLTLGLNLPVPTATPTLTPTPVPPTPAPLSTDEVAATEDASATEEPSGTTEAAVTEETDATEETAETEEASTLEAAP